jgi:hypothetical protein
LECRDALRLHSLPVIISNELSQAAGKTYFDRFAGGRLASGLRRQANRPPVAGEYCWLCAKHGIEAGQRHDWLVSLANEPKALG